MKSERELDRHTAAVVAWQRRCPLKRARHVKGWTQTELARAIGITGQSVWNLENGRYPTGSSFLFDLGRVLEAPDLEEQYERWLEEAPEG